MALKHISLLCLIGVRGGGVDGKKKLPSSLTVSRQSCVMSSTKFVALVIYFAFILIFVV